MSSLRVVIVDDEPVAIRRLQRLVSACDALVVGTATNAGEALDVIAREKPDLAFLDIEMPGPTGIDLAAKCRDLAAPPALIFVTAFSRFALAAFDLDADHYLLKPVEQVQVANALQRVRERLADRRDAARAHELDQVVKQLRSIDSDVDRDLWLSDHRGRARVPLCDVLWLAAERDYVRVHLDRKCYLVRGRIGDWADKLTQHGFIRVHRSFAVRANCIKRIHGLGDRRYRLTLSSGVEIEASRRFSAVVLAQARSLIDLPPPA